jgi:hypothetical protein
VRASYGEKARRLAALKAVWDPENVFRPNVNITPDPAATGVLSTRGQGNLTVRQWQVTLDRCGSKFSTARKHGVADDDILHALRNAVFDYPSQGDHELAMAIGPARDGVTMVEVGYLTSEDGLLVVIHAMRARRKYLEGA